MEHDGLKSELKQNYGIIAADIKLLNDYCASSYLICMDAHKYVFKLYRCFDAEIAMQSAEIMEYLLERSFPVAPIVHAKNGNSVITLHFSDGERKGVLYNFIEGGEGYNYQYESYAADIGDLIGRLHNIMEGYNKPIKKLDKEHYVGRYINLMKEFNYSPSKIAELDDYGNLLWSAIEKTRQGFCHGDLNPSNFIKNIAVSNDIGESLFLHPSRNCPINFGRNDYSRQYTLLDFDCAGFAYPIVDIFFMCGVDVTAYLNFNVLREGKFNEVSEKLALLRKGFEKHRILTEQDILAVYAFVGVICYWMTAQHDKYKSVIEGREWLNEPYFDKMYNWLGKWRNQCQENGLRQIT